eukprot:m.102264 g.102264  ORF g.102264 m.102264 type:complete len:72 (+) comp15006_c0_seq2:205-420(+)
MQKRVGFMFYFEGMSELELSLCHLRKFNLLHQPSLDLNRVPSPLVDPKDKAPNHDRANVKFSIDFYLFDGS